VLTVAFGLVGAGLILAQTGLLARALAVAARGDTAASLSGTLAALLVVVVARAAVSYGGEVAARSEAWRLRLGKCREFETDLGYIAVRQPRTRRSDKITMSREVRSYNDDAASCQADPLGEAAHDERWPVVSPALIVARTTRA
jgi:hypothetical protein